MAKYNIDHSCGHSEEHQLFGPHKERDRKLAWMEGTLCSECYRTAKDTERETQNKAAAEQNQGSGLPKSRLIAFGSTPSDLDSPDHLPSPAGGTALHLALDAAAKHRPRRTLVITDGHPDSEDSALASADSLSGIIDVIYCGPDGDTAAIAFLTRLARLGGGRIVVRDVARMARPSLGSAVRTVLGLPGTKE